MSTDKITLRTPDVLLDPNLEFSTEEPPIRELVLTRKRCIDSSIVDSFLKLLRNGSDDILRQKLSSYSQAQDNGRANSSKKTSCEQYLKKELYPNWQTRDQIISFCEGQSEQLKHELDAGTSKSIRSNVIPEIDPRLDPYSARRIIYDREAAYKDWKRLNSWIENNKKVESILRNSSAKTLKQNCDQNADYMAQFFSFINKTT